MRNTQFCIWIIDIVTTTIAFTCFNVKRKKTGSLLLTLTICGLNLHSSLFIGIHFNGFTLDKLQPKGIDAGINICFINPNKLIMLCHCFSLSSCECLIYHQQQYDYHQQ